MALGKNMNKRLGTSLGKIFGEEAVLDENSNNKNILNSNTKTQIAQNNSNNTNNNNQNQEEKIQQSATYIKINLVQPNKLQPRKNFDEEALAELTESIKNYGVVTPLIVKKYGSFYEIIAGERRWRAAKKAGLTEVPVVIKDIDEKTSKEIAIIENLQREDLNAVEEALAYQSLIDEYNLTQDEVARRVSKNRSTITNSLRLLKLDKTILDLVVNGKLSSGHARALLSIEDIELRNKIANRVIQENLSVRDIEKLVRLNDLGKYRDAQRKLQSEDKRLKIIYQDIEKKLKEKLKTKIKIIPKNENSGKIEIQYFSNDELDRIYSLLNSVN